MQCSVLHLIKVQCIGHLDDIGVEVEVLPEVGVHPHELPAVPVLGENEKGWVVVRATSHFFCIQTGRNGKISPNPWLTGKKKKF